MIDSLLARYSPGPEFEVGNASLTGEMQCSLSPQADGLLAAWTGNGDIYARRFSRWGVATTDPFRVNTYLNGSQQSPGSASLEIGSVIVWHSDKQDGHGDGIFGRMLAKTGTDFLNAEFQVNTKAEWSQRYPHPSALDNGFVVVYSSDGFAGPGFDVVGQRYNPIGTPVGDEFLINTRVEKYQLGGGVAAVGLGFVPVWSSNGQDGDGYGIYARLFSLMGDSRSEELHINNATEGQQMGPDIAASSSRVLIVWHGQDDNGWGIRGQLLDEQLRKIGPEIPVNTRWETGQLYPRVIASDSLFFVAWNSEHLGEGDDVYVRAVTHEGRFLGPEIRVNEVTPGHQRRPCLTTVEGGFAVAWQDEKRDGIFARIFSKIEPATSTAISSLHTPSLTFTAPPPSVDRTAVYTAIIAALAFYLCGSIALHIYRWQTKPSEPSEPASANLEQQEYTSARVEASVDGGHYQSSLPIQQPSSEVDYDAWGVIEEENLWRQQRTV